MNVHKNARLTSAGRALLADRVEKGWPMTAAATRLLSLFALVVIARVLISSGTSGAVAGYTILAVGLVNSVMFPTIFTLATEGMGPKTPQASGLLCMAIVGGAVIPVLTGMLADEIGSALSFLLPATCYLAIGAYGFWDHSNRVVAVDDIPVVAP